MTNFEVEKFIDQEQNEKYYSTSPLNIGNIYIIAIGEDGFIYSRETEYIKVIGIAECFGNKFTMDVHYWNFAEVVVKRKKFI